ncbi:benzoate 4-monooxygenase cytochrome P450 [Talaromyces proteolyticus]|uniref:Benzoate 4-monooxygenase cytochrome P450 n=1 Tax=Talaromyces proteolyticus TaxID=1131652 RepID=A0AAD4PX94_9EURO|nr:benzoate 4-monooxygenase cytochrome P450 [Talaromyces proteolyticus]KAH8699087.1 benzoate 4-monooxygenase cytochrome P450 [Talaromyces proteolyticus]
MAEYLVALGLIPIPATIVLAYILCLVVYRLHFSPLAHFPGSKLAAVTTWYEIYYDVILGGRFMWEIERMHQKYGPIVRINPFEIHVKDVRFYNTLYTGTTKKRNKYPWFIRAGAPGSSFSTAEYDHHRIRRGIISPYLSKRSVRSYEPIIQQKINRLCEHMLDTMRSGTEIELHISFLSFAVDVMSHLSFGPSRCFNLLESSSLSNNIRWRKGIKALFARLIPLRHLAFLVLLFRTLPLWLCALVDPSCADIDFVEKSRSVEESGIFSEILRSETLPSSERALDRVSDDAKFFIIAGTDAPSLAMAVIMFHILRDFEVLQKLVEELKTALPDPAKDPSLSRLEELPYLSAVIKEGFRISSVVTTRLPRIAPGEVLEYQGWRIPAGTPVSMSTYFIHNDPDIFPEPNSFKPERWICYSPDSNLDQYPTSFSKGGQSCLGPSMAYSWCYLAFATILRRFELELFDTTEENIKTIRDSFNAQPKKGFDRIKVKVPRQRK